MRLEKPKIIRSTLVSQRFLQNEASWLFQHKVVSKNISCLPAVFSCMLSSKDPLFWGVEGRGGWGVGGSVCLFRSMYLACLFLDDKIFSRQLHNNRCTHCRHNDASSTFCSAHWHVEPRPLPTNVPPLSSPGTSVAACVVAVLQESVYAGTPQSSGLYSSVPPLVSSPSRPL